MHKEESTACRRSGWSGEAQNLNPGQDTRAEPRRGRSLRRPRLRAALDRDEAVNGECVPTL